MNYEHYGWNHNVSTCQPYIKAYLSLAKKRQISAHVCQEKRRDFLELLLPEVRKIPRRRKWQPTLVFLPGKIPWTEEPGEL